MGMPTLHWEELSCNQPWGDQYRTPVPGGWLVKIELGNNGQGLTFLPDPDHAWDGHSLAIRPTAPTDATDAADATDATDATDAADAVDAADEADAVDG